MVTNILNRGLLVESVSRMHFPIRFFHPVLFCRGVGPVSQVSHLRHRADFQNFCQKLFSSESSKNAIKLLTSRGVCSHFPKFCSHFLKFCSHFLKFCSHFLKFCSHFLKFCSQISKFCSHILFKILELIS